MIHPAAIVHPAAEVDASCEIGPYAVIDAGVRLGPRCRVGPGAHLTGRTTIGADNVFHAGCVIGDAPQDVRYTGAPTGLRVGDRNVFREHVTVNRSNKPEEDTVIGSGCFLMTHAHVGHNSRLGDGVILANNVALAGHAEVNDRAFLSANTLVHQFTRVGTLAMTQGGAGFSLDLPPYCMAHLVNQLCGLNVVGLRRAGVGAAERLELKRLYRFLFREGRNLRAAVAEADGQFTSPPARVLLEFCAATKRGFLAHPGSPKAAAEVE